ncbi:MAG TPA: helix-turn-helix domain-containing protein [Gemmatimonadaceae bacterium]|nr:helix-turn-helix domain-containing protein [Gemmatimonadaceae bacterium]
MEVVARLSSSLASHLRIVLGREHTLTETGDWEALSQCIRSRPADVVVLDPRDGGGLRTDEVRQLLEQFESLPVVVYTTLSPESLQGIVKLAKHGVQHVVLRGFDDEPRRFRALLDRLPAYAMSERLLEALAGPLGDVPAPLVRAVERLFRSPHDFQDVGDLAAAAGMTRRSLDRWLDRAGVSSAKTLVVGARMLRAYHYMRDSGYLLEDVAVKLGYPTARLFARQMRLLTGCTPSVVRARVEPEEFVATLAARLRRRDCETGLEETGDDVWERTGDTYPDRG